MSTDPGGFMSTDPHTSPLEIHGVVLVPVDDDGIPVVEHFIMAMHDAVPDSMLDELQKDIPSALPVEEARVNDRFAITWGFLTAGIASTLLQIYPNDIERALDGFIDMLRTMVAQHQVEQEPK
jgi:hypothetical protein